MLNWVKMAQFRGLPGGLGLTCPSEGSHGLHHGRPQVEGSRLRSVPHHGKLPRHVVHGQRVGGELRREEGSPCGRLQRSPTAVDYEDM